MSNMDNIITSGCSFTETRGSLGPNISKLNGKPQEYYSQYENYKSWALHLEDLVSDTKIHNLAMPGIGNRTISQGVIHKVSEFLRDGVKPKAIIQWTSPIRYEFLQKASDLSASEFQQSFHYTKNLPFDLKTNLDSVWTKEHEDSMLFKRFNADIYTDKMAFIDMLGYILKTHWFLELNNIEYMMFFGWTPFEGMEFNNLESFRDGKELWDMMNWDKFLLYDTGNIKVAGSNCAIFDNQIQSTFTTTTGGISEWVKCNISNINEMWICGSHTSNGCFIDTHPSNASHRKFAEYLIKNIAFLKK